MKRKTLSRLLVVIQMLLATSVFSASIYLNGKRIDGVTNQKFENCTVSIDERGDVHIEAAGYAVESVTSNEPPIEPAPVVVPTKRYWLVKEENYPGKTQYDIDVYINSVWFKRIRSNEEQVVVDISKYLKPGANKVHFATTKNIGQQRKSFSPQVYMRLLIGEGNIGGNNVMIDRPLLTYTRTADETKNFNDEFTIQVE